MTSFSATEIDAVMGNYDFSPIQKLVDIGGGLGSLLATILKAYPHMQGILSDAPSVIDSARREIDKYGLDGRCELMGVDFFASVPAGGDTYMMKHIIHDWDDEHSLRILKNCHAVMQSGAKLLVIESVIAPGNEPSYLSKSCRGSLFMQRKPRRAAAGRWEDERPAHFTPSITRILVQMSCTVTASAGVVYRHSA
jgi:hypothetical protein